MASELEKLLAAQVADGELESTGSFTLNPEKLQEKLRRFLLPEPHAYILKLVQWAVAAEASRIKVEVGRKKVLFAHDGYQPDPETFVNWARLLESNWQDRPDERPAELELAMALNAIVALRVKRIKIALRNDDGTLHQIFDGEGDWQTHTATRRGSRLTVLAIEGRPAAFGSGLVSQLYRFGHSNPIGWTEDLYNGKIALAEKALLQGCCAYCPIPLQVNKKYVNQPFFNLSPTRKSGHGFLSVVVSNCNLIMGNHCFTYLLNNYGTAQLWAPSRHTGALVSSWYRPDERHPVVEIKSRNDFRVKGLESWTLDSKLSADGDPPLNALMMAIRSPQSLNKTSRLAGVVRGVNIETEVESSLPSSTFAVLSAPSLGTDLSGLRVKKSQARREFLADFSKRMGESFKRRRQ